MGFGAHPFEGVVWVGHVPINGSSGIGRKTGSFVHSLLDLGTAIHRFP